MAYGSNPGPASGGGGGEDYYSDAPAKAEASTGEEEAKPDEGAIETTIPKSMLMGKDFKVGEEVVFEITAIHGDEVSIKYATEGEEKGEGEGGEGEEGSAGAPPPKGDAEMSSMMY